MRNFFLLLILCVASQVMGQPFNLTVYREAEGLPTGYIENAMQDSRGYLWFSTFGGISRFDGKTFVNYDIKEGLPSKYCDGMTEDSKGRLWIATRRGLSMFDGKIFTNYQHPDSNYTSYIGQIEEGKDGVIRLLIGINETNGLYKLQNGRIVKDEQPKGFKDSTITIYRELENGAIIFKTPYNGYLVEPNGKLRTMPELRGQFTKILQEKGDSYGFYYLSEAGIFYWKNGLTQQITNLNFKGRIITTFKIDKEHRLWVADDSGVYVISADRKNVYFIDGTKDLPGYLVPDIFQDKQGTHWICTFRGLVKATDKYVQHLGAEDGLLDTDIQSSGYLTKGRIFMGNNIIQNGALYKYPQAVLNLYRDQYQQSPARNITLDEKDRLWMFGKYGDIYRYNGAKLENLTPKLGKLSPWPNCFDTVTNTIWFGTRTQICQYRNDSIIQTTTRIDDGSPLRSVVAVKRDIWGNVWISERDRIILSDGKHFKDVTGLFKLLQKVTIVLQVSDSTGLWFSTAGFGAIHLKRLPNNTFEKDIELDNTSGLPNNEVMAIAKDDFNYLWVATLTGLFRIDLKKANFDGTYNVYPISANEGVNVNNWNLAFLERDQFKNVWMGTANGVFKIETGKINTTTPPPAIQIEDIQVSNKQDNWQYNHSDTGSKFAMPLQAVFTYTENNIVFTCQGINLKSGFVRYLYILEGQEKNWHSNQVFNKATYNNLAPAKYRFRVKAINEYGVASTTEAIFSFEIKPPFWQTWWLRLLVAAGVIAAIYYFVKRREKRIQKDSDLALKMSELKLTALQSQMNPHFIFNSLNSIQNYIMQQKPVAAARYLSKFSRLIRRILDHSFNHLEPLTEILETIKMYVELEAFRFSNEFRYNIELRDEDEIGRAELPPMLLQPFVENAIIHGLMPKEGDKHLSIIMEKRNDQVLISIEDNGVGRKEEVEKRPGHISRAQKIVDDMLQTMQSLQGVQPTINFIDRKDEAGNAAGTRVEILVPLK
ncbi:MAG: two-component regulator propeller domain-containing protein [Chitinophagaceae bacterium]